MSNGMNKPRFRQLIRVLKTYKHVPNQRRFIGEIDGETIEFDMRIFNCPISPGACDYAACALGSAAHDPYFKDLGLRSTMMDVFLAPKTKNGNFGVYGFQAGQVLFNVSFKISNWLFFPYAYRYQIGKRNIEPADVIKRIEFLMKYGQNAVHKIIEDEKLSF